MRTSDLDALAEALRVSDVTSTLDGDGALVVDSDDLRLIGDVALQAGLPIYELRHASTDLEALFFSLTEGTNRNLGAAAVLEHQAIQEREGVTS